MYRRPFYRNNTSRPCNMSRNYSNKIPKHTKVDNNNSYRSICVNDSTLRCNCTHRCERSNQLINYSPIDLFGTNIPINNPTDLLLPKSMFNQDNTSTTPINDVPFVEPIKRSLYTSSQSKPNDIKPINKVESKPLQPFKNIPSIGIICFTAIVITTIVAM